jgi:hypothetical protein
VVAGVLLGLAAAVKVTAALAWPFVLLLAVPAGRRGWATARAGGVLLPAAIAGYAVPAGLTGLGLGFLNGLERTDDSTQWTSIPSALGMTVGYALRAVGVDGMDAAVTTTRQVALAAGVAIVAALWVRARREPAVRATLWAAGAAFGTAALLGPVFYPWYVLTPLALLAVSTVDDRARDWLGAGSAALTFLILPDGTGLAPRTKLPGALAVTAGVVVAVVRRLRPRSPAPDGPTTPTAPAS